MDRSLSIDRFEGPNKETAVLVDEDGTTREVPRADLPAGAKAGDVLTPDLSRVDAEATAALASETRRVQDELKARDPGGDIEL